MPAACVRRRLRCGRGETRRPGRARVRVVLSFNRFALPRGRPKVANSNTRLNWVCARSTPRCRADRMHPRQGSGPGLTAAADRARPGSSTATPGTARGHPADIADRGLHGRNTGGPRRGTGPAGRGPRLAVLRPTPYLLPIRPVPGAWWLYRIQNRSRAECRCRRGATVPVRCPTHPLQHSRSETRPPAPARGRVRRAEPSSLAAASGLAGRTDDRHGEHAGHSTLTDH